MIRPRTLWLAALVAIVVLVVSGAVMVAMLPQVVRTLAIWRLEALTQRRVSIESVELNVFTGHVAVRGLQVDERDEPGALVRVERVAGRVHRRSLLRLHVWIEDLAVERPAVHIVRLPGNRLNISDLLDRPSSPGGTPVSIDHLRVGDGVVVVEDRTLRPPRTWRAERIAVDARNLSTARADGTATASTIVAGAPLHVSVEDLRLTPLHLRAHVTVANVDLALLRLYLPGDAAVLPESGILAAGVRITHEAGEGTRISAGARIRRVALERRGQDGHFATSPEVTVTLNELHVRDGAFSVERAEVDGDLSITEAVREPPVTYDLQRTRLIAEDLAWPGRRPGRLSFTGVLPGGGSLDIRGTLQPEPLVIDAHVKLAGADLRHANRYAALTGVITGTADADARVVATWSRALAVRVTGSVGASRVAITDSRTATARPPLAAERLEAAGIDYEWPARIALATLVVRKPSAQLERDAAGAFTLAELFRRPAPEGAPPPADVPAAEPAPVEITPDVTVGELRVEGGALTLIDGALTPAARVEIADVALDLRNVAWPARPGVTQVSLAAGLPGGGAVNASGTATLEQRSARLRVTLKGVDLAQAQPYLPFPAQVSGQAEGDLDVRARLDPLRLRVRGTVAVDEAVLVDRDQPLLAVQRIEAGGVDFRWPLRLVVDQLSVRKPWAKIQRDEHGELTLRAAFRPRPGAPAPQPATGDGAAAAPPPKPEITVKRMLFEDGGTSIFDDSVEPAARFEVRGTRLEVRNITYPVKLPAEVALATPMPGGGRLEGRGTFQVEPGRMDLSARLAGVALAPAQPYLPVEARLAGTIDGNVRISASFEPLALTVRGNVALGDVTVGDEHRSLLTAARTQVRGVTVEWPDRVRVRAVDVERPWVLLERETSGLFPLIRLLTPQTRPASPRAAGEAARSPGTRWQVEVGTVALHDGFGRFVDRTAEPDFAEELSNVQLTIAGFSTTPEATGRISLRATVGPAAPLSLNGEFKSPTGPRGFDLLFTLGDYPAPRSNAYLRTLFGWTARAGTLSVAAHYVVNGDELEATNDVGADGLALERAPGVQKPKWPISLPLDTFVSLLKNRNGDLQLSVPIHGSISSPEFELGDAIWSALRNIAIKTVALPFSLIGSLFITEDSRIETLQVNPVVFEAGTATPAAGMQEHLARLGGFLREKPAVRLLQRPVLTVHDVARLKHEALRERLGRQGGPLPETLARLYAEKFPRRAGAPATVDQMVAALAEGDPAPTAASAALAQRRVQTVREALGAHGVDTARLPVLSSAPIIEGEGAGRVEFEITH